MKILIGICIPFLGTAFGSFMVFLMKDTINKNIEKILLGFASGIMISASIWSLIIPALELKEIFIVSIGFILGILFLIIIEYFISGLNNKAFRNINMLFFLLHFIIFQNGMAVGIIFLGVLTNNPSITISVAYALSIGIAIQNFPEGAIISMPLKAKGFSNKKAFFMAFFLE